MSRVENNKNKRLQKRKRKKSLGFKILMFLIISLIVVSVVGFGYLYGLSKKIDTVKLNNKDLGIPSKDEFIKYDNYKDIKNIALFGIDSEDSENGRSDSMIIATIDPVHNKLKITSLMRDSYVDIEGHGKDKLNHAYAFGGPKLALNTINSNFGLNVEDFATVNFDSLPIIIDALGGLDLKISDAELPYVNDYINSLNQLEGTSTPHLTYSGMQHLTGMQALSYSRIRATAGGDFERTERHRIVLSAIFSKLSAISPSTYPSILNTLLPYVQTSLTNSDILSLGTKVLGLGIGPLEQDRFPRDGFAQGVTINNIYYLEFDKDATITQMRDYIFGDK